MTITNFWLESQWSDNERISTCRRNYPPYFQSRRTTLVPSMSVVFDKLDFWKLALDRQFELQAWCRIYCYQLSAISYQLS